MDDDNDGKQLLNESLPEQPEDRLFHSPAEGSAPDRGTLAEIVSMIRRIPWDMHRRRIWDTAASHMTASHPRISTTLGDNERRPPDTVVKLPYSLASRHSCGHEADAIYSRTFADNS